MEGGGEQESRRRADKVEGRKWEDERSRRREGSGKENRKQGSGRRERAGLGLRGAEGGDKGSRERVVGGVETGCSQCCTSIILSLTVSKLPALV